MSALRKQMQADMVLRGLAANTQESYVAAVVRLSRYYDRSPAKMSEAEVQHYLLHLIDERKLAWSSTNVAACAFRFLFHVTLKQCVAKFIIPGRKVPAKLPEILSREEVNRILSSCLNIRHRAMLMTTYAAGLRLSETCHLKVADIDSGRMMLRIVNGKGGKDRYSLLSPALLETLRSYWRANRPALWLFPQADATRPVDQGTLQKCFYAAKHRAGIAKEGGIHSLRHGFATHLLEAGVGIHTIKTLMGHDNISTTARYLHMRQQVVKTGSPLDLLSALAPLDPLR
jgi:integrase/recombinase XerD